MDLTQNRRLLHEACRLHGCPFQLGTPPMQMAATLMMRKQLKRSSPVGVDSAAKVVKRVPLVQSTYMQEELETVKSYVGDASDDRITFELKRRWDIKLQACLEEFQPDSYKYLPMTDETDDIHADMIKDGWYLIAEDTSGKYYANQERKKRISKETDPSVDTKCEEKAVQEVTFSGEVACGRQ